MASLRRCDTCFHAAGSDEGFCSRGVKKPLDRTDWPCKHWGLASECGTCRHFDQEAPRCAHPKASPFPKTRRSRRCEHYDLREELAAEIRAAVADLVRRAGGGGE